MILKFTAMGTDRLDKKLFSESATKKNEIIKKRQNVSGAHETFLISFGQIFQANLTNSPKCTISNSFILNIANETKRHFLFGS